MSGRLLVLVVLVVLVVVVVVVTRRQGVVDSSVLVVAVVLAIGSSVVRLSMAGVVVVASTRWSGSTTGQETGDDRLMIGFPMSGCGSGSHELGEAVAVER